MSGKLSERDLDIRAEDDIPDWKTPPVEEIIRRKLKSSSKKRLCRSQMQKEYNKYEASRDNSSLQEDPDVSYPVGDYSETTAISKRISSPHAVGFKIFSGEKHMDYSNRPIIEAKSKPVATGTLKSSHSEPQTHSSQECLPQPVGRSQLPQKNLSVSFIPDLLMTKSSPSEQRPVSSKVKSNPLTSRFSYQYSGAHQQRPKSCHASVSSTSSSASSIENAKLIDVQHDEEFTINQSLQKSMLQPEDDSDEYDTDFEAEKDLDSRELEIKEKQVQLDTDIGHITYKNICKRNGMLPRTRVCKQLWEKKLDLRHAGLLTAEVKAVALALSLNHRIEEVDVSNNSMTDQAVTYVIDTLLSNMYVTKLNLAENKIEINGAVACGTLLSRNKYIMSLNLSGCFIGDNEVGYISQGIQVNNVLQQLNLSRNRIGPLGALQLSKAFGENVTLTSINLSWNHIRGGGAVALGNSLKRNKKLEELDISWNGLGFEGSIAFGETLRVNKMLKRLNLENNRIDWEGAHYLAKGLALNRSLEVLQVGLNPISMHGCEEIIKAVAKPISRVSLLSLKDIPINTKLALRASDITRCRDFTIQHGGILKSKDGIGIQRTRREDPFFLLIRYLSIMGIRVVDLFRMFDKDNNLYVSKERFIQGLKKVRVPLDDEDLQVVATRLRSNKRGDISYQELATSVRNRIVKNRQENKRLEMIQRKKQDEKLRILQLDKPLHEISNMSSLYGMCQSRQSDRPIDNSSAIANLRRRDSSFTPLPLIRNVRGVNLVEMSNADKASYRSQKSESYHINSDSLSRSSVSTVVTGQRLNQRLSTVGQRSGSSYVNEMRIQQTSNNIMRKHRFM